MQVDPEAWPVLSRLMDEWLDLPEDRRAAWLTSLEPQHADLLPTLRELLSQQLKPAFLEALPVLGDGPGDAQAAPGSFAPGALAGPYRLERELGRGGMGVVWLGTRADGSLKRDVALKFPLFSFPDPALTSRFARERDILERLEDARIARLYDAGVTANGQPYLALEYVEGEAITAYCDRLRLDLRARLKLFLDVLQAVQYAHANLVVHRDLKPSNILVTNAGQVRLLDFGIARLLEEGEAAETDITRSGGRALTPDYASPEQIAGHAITTATDIYSLGILLYELLTGSRPYRLPRGASGGDLAASLLGVNPARPSQATTDELPAGSRGGLTAKALAATLRGDLDTIILKAIQKEPQARYSTADAFAQDIERYLTGQPVLARPESRWYRARKFVLRNKLAVSAAMTAVLALAAGAGIALWQAHRAVGEKRRADTEAATAGAISDFLQKDLLSQAGSATQAGPGRPPDPDIKVRTALDRAAARLAGKFDTRPAVEAAIRQTIGNTYLELGLYADSEKQMERALELRRRVLGEEHQDTLKSALELSEVYRHEGKYEKSEVLLNRLLEVDRRQGRGNAPEAIAALHTLASLAGEGRGDWGRAEVLYRQVLEIERHVLGEADTTTLATMNNLAAALARENKYPEAEEIYGRLLEIKRRILGAEHPSTLTSLNGLGVLYRNEGKYAEAEPVLRSVLEARRHAMGEEHRDTLASMNGLGLLYLTEGKYTDAEPLLTHAVETGTRVLGEANPDTQSSLNNLAELYRREGKLTQSEAALERLLKERQRTYGQDNGFTANTLAALGEVKLQRRAFAEASVLLRGSVDYYRKHNVDIWRRYYTECMLGASLTGLGRNAEGESLLDSASAKLLQRKDSIPSDYRPILDKVRQWTERAGGPRR
jgi:serine/threonine protein kinase/tetratricopeptide (TPR) repeat protein